MNKKLIQNIDEYRQWAWDLYDKLDQNYNAECAMGLVPIHDCWDSIENEDGTFTDIDEDGSPIPEDTAETVELEDWVNEIEFPCVVLYTFEKTWVGIDMMDVYLLEYVSLSEFSEPLQ